MKNKLTIAHVTHEAVDKLGGIGTVIEGLLTSPVYKKHVGRSILIGPTATHLAADPTKRLGDDGVVLYSSVDHIDKLGLANRLRPIEWAFNVALIYGKRYFRIPGDVRTGEADVLLIDCFRTNPDRLALFKLRLAQTFGIDSTRYEKAWDYEEYVRLAEPAFYGLMALLKENQLPAVILSHEFMGLPMAFKAILDGQREFRTIFYAHECSTARQIVEHAPGHDTMFYNILHQARAQGLYVEDVFGDQSGFFRHALISRSHVCDGIVAVGDYTAEEIYFLGRQFNHHVIDLVYNGLPAFDVSLSDKLASRKMLQDYSHELLGYRPDVLMTHVTRPVISKGLWRDMKVCHELSQRLAADGKTGVLYILTTAGGTRRTQDVRSMESQYGWPRHHRQGYPDLVGPEVDFNNMIEPFNKDHPNLQVVLVNQFGWSPERIGTRLPPDMDIADLRRASDVEFGMATYEPFGISPLEPLNAGALCVFSNVCGAKGFVDYVTDGVPIDNVVVADFTKLDREWSIAELKNMTQHDRDRIELRIAAEVGQQIHKRLPATETATAHLIRTGQRLVSKMGWDQVLEHKLVPLLQQVVASGPKGKERVEAEQLGQAMTLHPSPAGKVKRSTPSTKTSAKATSTKATANPKAKPAAKTARKPAKAPARKIKR